MPAIEPEGQPAGAPVIEPQAQEPDWASAEVEVTPGKKMRLGDVVKSTGERERRMHEATTEASQLREEMKNLEFAREVQRRYWAEPDFRERYDALFEGQPQQRIVAPEVQQLRADVSELQTLKFDRDFDRLRAKGHEVSKDDEIRALTEVKMGRAGSVEQAYRNIFWDREISKARENASTATARHMAETRNLYQPPPKGGAPSKSSPKTMTAAEREAHAIRALGEVMGE
jgi:hypothetical protein